MTKQAALRQIEEILVADYPAEEASTRACVANETAHAKCSPIWLHDMTCADQIFTDAAIELIRDVCDEYYYRS